MDGKMQWNATLVIIRDNEDNNDDTLLSEAKSSEGDYGFCMTERFMI